MLIQKASLILGGIFAFLTAAAHALIGQSHLTRIQATSTETIDSAVMFAVWHMVTIILFVSAFGLLLLSQSKQHEVVKVCAVAASAVYFLFGIVFIGTSFLYNVSTIQWIPMMMISILCWISYRSEK